MDLKQYRSKLIGSEDERAVSPVIGVILMVAITVILAAVIAAFVLDMGQGQSANAQAGVAFDHDTSNEEVTVTINSVSRADDLYVQCGSNTEGEGNTALDSTGESTTVKSGSSGSGMDCTSDQIQVIGVVDGSESVITSFDEHL